MKLVHATFAHPVASPGSRNDSRSVAMNGDISFESGLVYWRDANGCTIVPLSNVLFMIPEAKAKTLAQK